MAGETIQSSDGPQRPEKGTPSLADPPENVPAWFSTRRDQKMREDKGKQVPSHDSGSIPPLGATVLKPVIPPLPGQRVNPKTAIVKVDKPSKDQEETHWISKQGLIGIVTSLGIHAVILVILACILVSQVTTQEVSSIFGTNGTGDEFAADVILETEVAGEGAEAGEAAPLQTSDLSKVLDSIGKQGDIAESMRVGLGGQGEGGEGEGDGNSVGVPNVRVPGYAQTKGSFSAWADPKDPKPGEDYFVVIQVRLPSNVTKYRGSDVSGNVIGTDGYKQPIRLKSNVMLPVEDGAVQIRIPVPGARQLVRDTIRVESKLLKEKQTFEIEF
ncbi:hypothetical protein [Schlesneria sp. DSM 10557]|uniref:hypothetical protein n=2 Tax=unclassified Schlesneria TaxID=2762017 RepID=UPI00359FCCAC